MLGLGASPPSGHSLIPYFLWRSDGGELGSSGGGEELDGGVFNLKWNLKWRTMRRAEHTIRRGSRRGATAAEGENCSGHATRTSLLAALMGDKQLRAWFLFQQPPYLVRSPRGLRQTASRTVAENLTFESVLACFFFWRGRCASRCCKQ